jgi:hypothetical protein
MDDIKNTRARFVAASTERSKPAVVLAVVAFCFCAWAVLLGGVAAMHGKAASDLKTTAEIELFSFSWFLVCGYLIVLGAFLVVYALGLMPLAVKTFTAVISIFIAWLGVESRDVLEITVRVRAASLACLAQQ